MLLVLRIMHIVRGHSPVISFSFRLRFVVFLCFVFIACLCLVISLFFACFVSFICVLPVLLFLLLCPFVVFFDVFDSFFASFIRCFFVVLRRLRSFVVSLHRRRISYCGPLSRMAVFATAPSSVVFIFDFRLPVVVFLLLRRLRFTSRSLSASTDAGDLVSDIGTLSIVVEVAKPQAFTSARVA